MPKFFDKYFLNTKSWSDFWDQTLGLKYHSQILQTANLQATVFIYPWYFGQKYGMVSKAPSFSQEFVEQKSIPEKQQEVQDFIWQITKYAKQQGLSFLKIDFDHQLFDLLDVSELQDKTRTLTWLQQKTSYQVKIASKTLQYPATITLDISINSKYPETVFDSPNLQKYFQENQDFWKQRGQRVRRYTKKVLRQDWQIQTQKTAETWQAFWELHQHTCKQKGFRSQPKTYLEKQFWQDFSRIIIIKNSDNQPVTAWLGLVNDSTITYIAGGNTDFAYQNYTQYLTHLCVIAMASQENLKFYDLGGHYPETGFGQFKMSYHGTVREFVGPFDILLEPMKYHLINSLINLAKRLLGKKSVSYVE